MNNRLDNTDDRNKRHSDFAQEPAELAAQRDFFERKYSDTLHSEFSLLAAMSCCQIRMKEDLRIALAHNPYSTFGGAVVGKHISEVLEPAPSTRYFAELFDLQPELRRMAEAAEEDSGQKWEIAFDGNEGGLSEWSAYPIPSDWHFENGAVVTPDEPKERYLVSPVELIGPEDDFRVEYTAIAPSNPCDLSVVVGSELVAEKGLRPAQIPEHGGYCFAFGAHNNACSQLQRLLRPVWESDIRIQPGREYRCIAERIGGRLRLIVDEETVFDYIDPMPLMDKGRGFAAIYTCGAKHRFSDFVVKRRPTCIPEETLRRIDAMKLRIFRTRGGPERYFGCFYLGREAWGAPAHHFLFQDVSDVVFARQEAFEQSLDVGFTQKALETETRRLVTEKARHAELIDRVRTVVEVADEVLACEDLDSLLKSAVELSRSRLGLERCAIFLPDNDHMQGTFGTNLAGETTDERSVRFRKDEWWYNRFRHLHPSEPHWDYVERSHTEVRDGEVVEIGRGWIAVTPIRAGKEVVGLFFNDTARTHQPLETGTQDIVEIFCSILGHAIKQKRPPEQEK